MTDSVDYFLQVAGDVVPRLIGAVAILLAAFIGAVVLQRFLERLLSQAGLDDLSERTGASYWIWRLGYSGGPSRLLSLMLFIIVIITGIAGSLSALGIASLEQTTNEIVNLSRQALVSLSILLAGIMSAGWLSELVGRESERAGLRGINVFRRVTFGAVFALAALLAASQLGIETSVLVLLMAVVLAAAGLTVALALGPGLVPLSANVAAGRYVREDLSVGDEISLDGAEGTVEELGYASVILRSEDGYLYRVPNRTLMEGIVRKKA